MAGSSLISGSEVKIPKSSDISESPQVFSHFIASAQITSRSPLAAKNKHYDIKRSWMSVLLAHRCVGCARRLLIKLFPLSNLILFWMKRIEYFRTFIFSSIWYFIVIYLPPFIFTNYKSNPRPYPPVYRVINRRLKNGKPRWRTNHLLSSLSCLNVVEE